MSKLSMDEDLLITNNFIDTNVYDISNDKNKQNEYLRKQIEFRKFMENKTNDFSSLNHPLNNPPIRYLQEGGIVTKPTVAVIGETGPEAVIPLNEVKNLNPFSNTNIVNDSKGSGYGNSGTAGSAGGSSLINNSFSNRFSQDIHTMISIDSRDRDQTLYGNQNHYKIRLRRTFTNVTVIKLKSTEFPNTLQLIRSTPIAQANNIIIWQNEEDGDQEYNASLTPGNYTATTLAREIENQMNSVRRNAPSALPYPNPYHNFSVDIDIVTDIVTISSISQVTVANPFKPLVGNYIEVTYSNADDIFELGDNVIISDSLSFTGIDASFINTTHVITHVDINSFQFKIDDNIEIINNTGIGYGGTSVKIGKGLNWRILFSREHSFSNILGFPNEDTEFNFIQTNARIKTTLYIEEINFHSSILCNVTTTTDHGLQTGERIFISNYNNLYYDPITELPPTLTEEQLLSNAEVVKNINSVAGHIITVVDPNNFLIPVNLSFFLTSESVPPRPDPIPAENGIIEVRTLNKGISLSGENYIMLVSPQINSMETTNNNIPEAFYKIQLSSSPGSVIFNSFIGNPKVFYDTPLTYLDELEWFFRQYDGQLFEFNDSDHSFTIEIVETIQKIEGQGESSKIGVTT